MEWLLLLLIGGSVYLFIKAKARWDMELIRSHVYLDALANGEQASEANAYSMRVMAWQSSRGILHLAQLQLLHDFDNNRPLMVAKAYGLGMTAQLRPFEQEFFGVASSRPSPTPPGATPTWVRPFVLFYLQNNAGSEGSWPMPDAPKMTRAMQSLWRGQMTQELQMSMPAALRLYLSYTRPDVEQYDTATAIQDAQMFLAEAIKSFSSPAVLSSYIQSQSTLDTGSPMSLEELTQIVTVSLTGMTEGTDVGLMMRDAMLYDLVERQFKAVHGSSFNDFRSGYLAYYKDRAATTDAR